MSPLSIFSSIISPVTNFFTKRHNNKTAVKQAKIARIVGAEDQLAEWERIQAEGGVHSWKDEWFTVILSIPAIMCFFPDLVIHVENGFIALQGMPEFYQYWLSIAICTSFGIRVFKKQA